MMTTGRKMTGLRQKKKRNEPSKGMQAFIYGLPPLHPMMSRAAVQAAGVG
jgi:hypothetical protein